MKFKDVLDPISNDKHFDQKYKSLVTQSKKYISLIDSKSFSDFNDNEMAFWNNYRDKIINLFKSALPKDARRSAFMKHGKHGAIIAIRKILGIGTNSNQIDFSENDLYDISKELLKHNKTVILDKILSK